MKHNRGHIFQKIGTHVPGSWSMQKDVLYKVAFQLISWVDNEGNIF